MENSEDIKAEIEKILNLCDRSAPAGSCGGGCYFQLEIAHHALCEVIEREKAKAVADALDAQPFAIEGGCKYHKCSRCNMLIGPFDSPSTL